MFFKLPTRLPIKADQNVYPPLLKTEKMPLGTHDVDKIKNINFVISKSSLNNLFKFTYMCYFPQSRTEQLNLLNKYTFTFGLTTSTT